MGPRPGGGQSRGEWISFSRCKLGLGFSALKVTGTSAGWWQARRAAALSAAPRRCAFCRERRRGANPCAAKAGPAPIRHPRRRPGPRAGRRAQASAERLLVVRVTVARVVSESRTQLRHDSGESVRRTAPAVTARAARGEYRSVLPAAAVSRAPPAERRLRQGSSGPDRHAGRSVSVGGIPAPGPAGTDPAGPDNLNERSGGRAGRGRGRARRAGGVAVWMPARVARRTVTSIRLRSCGSESALTSDMGGKEWRELAVASTHARARGTALRRPVGAAKACLRGKGLPIEARGEWREPPSAERRPCAGQAWPAAGRRGRAGRGPARAQQFDSASQLCEWLVARCESVSFSQKRYSACVTAGTACPVMHFPSFANALGG